MRRYVFLLNFFLTITGQANPFESVAITGEAKDLMKLEAADEAALSYLGQKFVLTREGELIVSLTGQKKPKHDDLGESLDVVSAGYIRLAYHGHGGIAYIRVNNRSKNYCPSYLSLDLVEGVLKKMAPGVPVKKYNEPSDSDDCVEAYR